MCLRSYFPAIDEMTNDNKNPPKDPFWKMFIACMMAIAVVDVFKKLGIWGL